MHDTETEQLDLYPDSRDANPDVGFDTQEYPSNNSENKGSGEGKEKNVLPSPDLDESDVEHADEFIYKSEDFGTYQIKEVDGEIDLYSGDNKIGQYVSEEDRSEYSSAVEDAFNYGRGVWISQSEDTIYANVIIRVSDTECESHTYTRLITLEKEEGKKEFVEEPPVEEILNELPIFPTELEPEYSELPITSEDEITSQDVPHFFTPRELSAYATEVNSIDQQLAEIPLIENSDATISVENASLVNAHSIETIAITEESLNTAPVIYEHVVASPELGLQEEARVDEIVIDIPDITIAEAVFTDAEAHIDNEIQLTFEDEKPEQIQEEDIALLENRIEKEVFLPNLAKNKAVISSITNATEVSRVTTPEKTLATAEILHVEGAILHEGLLDQEELAIAEQVITATTTAEKVEQQKPSLAIESFDDLFVQEHFEIGATTPEVQQQADLGDTMSKPIVEKAPRTHIEVAPAAPVIETTPRAPKEPDAGPSEALEKNGGIFIVEKTTMAEPVVINEQVIEDTRTVETQPFSELATFDTGGISITPLSTERRFVAQEIRSIPTSVQNQARASVTDDALATSDTPEPLALAA